MTVYLVGAGPGDPGLITVRGAELLRKAQAVVYDRLANPELLKLVPQNAVMVSAGKGPGSVDLTQDQINEKLVELGSRFENVVRLKGGDPYVFGRGGEEALYLNENKIAFEVVPGITSAIAGPAYAGISVTQRGVSTNFTVVTGHEDPTKDAEQVKWAELAKVDGTIVVLMGVANREKIADALIAGGKKPDTPVGIVRNATLTKQKTLRSTLADLGSVQAKNPSVMVIGDVAGYNLDWFENKPLFGKKIVVTRAREQQSKISKKLSLLGAEVIEASAIKIMPLDFEFPEISDSSYAVFTSTNGVVHTFEKLFEKDMDARYFANCSIAAIGESTANELLKYGLKADLVPETFVAEELLELFPGADPNTEKVVLFRAKEVRDALEVGLKEKGYEVVNVNVYETLLGSVNDDLKQEVKNADAITFASSSTVENSITLFGLENVKDIPIKVSIGPITTSTMQEHGLEPSAQAVPHTIPGIIDALVESFSISSNNTI